MGYNDKYPDMSAMYAVQFEYENKLKDKIKNLETELDRTRKALDVAVDALKVYANPENWDCEHFYSLDARDIAGDVLEQITALEQRD